MSDAVDSVIMSLKLTPVFSSCFSDLKVGIKELEQKFDNLQFQKGVSRFEEGIREFLMKVWVKPFVSDILHESIDLATETGFPVLPKLPMSVKE